MSINSSNADDCDDAEIVEIAPGVIGLPISAESNFADYADFMGADWDETLARLVAAATAVEGVDPSAATRATERRRVVESVSRFVCTIIPEALRPGDLLVIKHDIDRVYAAVEAQTALAAAIIAHRPEDREAVVKRIVDGATRIAGELLGAADRAGFTPPSERPRK